MLKRYGLYGSLRLVKSLLFTKLFHPKSRLIRLPFDLRNRSHIKLGNNLTTGFGCRIEAHPILRTSAICIRFGDNIEINDYVHIAAGQSVTLGNNVLIASKVYISDINHGSYKGDIQDNPLTAPGKRSLSASPIVIKDNVWIGESVCILPGVTIGKGAIIGALSVVSKDIPDFCVAVGSPAKVIKKYDFEMDKWVSVNQ